MYEFGVVGVYWIVGEVFEYVGVVEYFGFDVFVVCVVFEYVVD